jgi:hypothetical protein
MRKAIVPSSIAILLAPLALAAAAPDEWSEIQVDPQGNVIEMRGGGAPQIRDEMSELERVKIMDALEQSRQSLVAQGKLSSVPSKAITTFAWPLRLAGGRNDLDFHGISNFVDEDPAAQILDYQCTARSYDGHRGTDIYTWPWSWKKMDDEDVVIAAGAPGTIIYKSDGNTDRSCVMNSNQWNAVYVQQADGSVTWYGHMKNGSPTVKPVGERVVTGEYLGVVGSSGNSTGPHLHIEFYDVANQLVDPWLGACNGKSKKVTWAQQRAFYDTGVNAMTVGNVVPVAFRSCPDTSDETPNATDYPAAGQTYFTIYLRDQVLGDKFRMRVLRPDGSVFAGPIDTGDGIYSSSYWYISTSLPSTPAGVWTFETWPTSDPSRKSTRTFNVGGTPNYGAAAAIVIQGGSGQGTTRGSRFSSPLQVKVTDAQARPVPGEKVTFTVPATGATVVLSSRTALTDSNGIASVTGIATATAGSYNVSASIANGSVAAVQFALQNGVTSPVAVTASLAGSGTGVVASSPQGISCGGGTGVCVQFFGAGTTVTLTATPNAGSVFSGWSGGDCVGTSTCTISVIANTVVTATFAPATTVPRLVNISTRMQVQTGNNVLIGGLIIGGSAAKTVVIRARGPSLAPAGIVNFLADPALTVVRSADGAVLAQNDNWQGAPNAAAISASGYAPDNALEAAAMLVLAPGAYTAIVSGTAGTGVGIVEVFEVDAPTVPLINISTRGQVLTGNDVMIGGFIIQGTGSQTVVVRARGPSLAAAGITNPLANPTLQLVRSSDNAILATNNDWTSATNALAITASGFAPDNNLESAILMTLPPGAYTAIVSGVAGGTGVGIIEVFTVQ